MSNTNDTAPITLDDLKYVWTPSGLPCFYADRPGIEEMIESLGFSIYYLVCNIATDKTIPAPAVTPPYTGPAAKPTVVTEFTTGIVKVVKNIIGRSVSKVSDHVLELDSVRESALYTMPPIPKVIVDKLDEFFRLVDAKHGTESIVILTFDPSKNDSSGWGVLVPDQTNTSVHCKYDPDSIAAQKPDDVMIVGSVHSHPGMAAYASGTDHADQADFDGLHITYGWQKTVNNGATQYYIEMQMAGSSWTLKPEDVFENFTIEKDPDPDVLEWAGKVKKALPPLWSQAGVHTPATATTATTRLAAGQTTRATASTATGADDYFQPDKKYQDLPAIDSNENYIIVSEMDPADKDPFCMSCRYELSAYDFQVGYCNICDVPIVTCLQDLNSIFAHVNFYMNNRKMTQPTAVYLWSFDDQSNDKETLMKLGVLTPSNEFNQSSYVRSGKEIIDISLSDYSNDEDDVPLRSKDLEFREYLTGCCGKEDFSNCNCETPFLFEDVVDFRNAHAEQDVYHYNSKCYSCEFFETPSCSSYVNAITSFVRTRRMIDHQISDCLDYQEYSRTFPVDSYNLD
jgi:hypothetical protein